MRRLGPLAAIIVAAAVSFPGASSAAEMHEIITPDSIKWEEGPAGLPKGALFKVLAGDPGKNEMFVLRAKLPDGYVVPAHWHSRAEHITVLTGALHIGTGDKLDKAKAQAVNAGGFFSMPGQMRHYVWTTGETIIQVSGMGPFDITYVDPSDDPRTGTVGAR